MGMKMLIDALALTEPIAAFNGGVFVRPDLSVISQNFLAGDDDRPRSYRRSNATGSIVGCIPIGTGWCATPMRRTSCGNSGP